MCPNFQVPNQFTIKDKFPISIINDLLDEIHGTKFFTKVNLHSRYHQIQMKEVSTQRQLSTHMKAIMSFSDTLWAL